MSVHRLPIWKQNSTAAEKFQELALEAAEHPEQFEHVVICYSGNDHLFNWHQHGLPVMKDAIGLLEACKLDIFRLCLPKELSIDD